MRDKNTIFIFGIICITLFIYGILFWPTLYRYEKVRTDNISLLLKINRITGYTERLNPTTGWITLYKLKEIHKLPKNESAKVIIRGDFDGKGHFKFDVYNGSNWNIKKIRLLIEMINRKDKKNILQRIYETAIDVLPYSTGHGSVKLLEGTPETWGYGRFVARDPEKEKLANKFADKELLIKAGGFDLEVKIEELFGYNGE